MTESPGFCVAVTHYNSERSDDYAMGPSLCSPRSELVWAQVMSPHPVKGTLMNGSLD